jgi:hypothetical protein
MLYPLSYGRVPAAYKNAVARAGRAPYLPVRSSPRRRPAARAAFDRAARHGLRGAEAPSRFAALAEGLGADFDERLPWARPRPMIAAWTGSPSTGATRSAPSRDA